MGSANPVIKVADLSHFAPLNQLGPALVEELIANSRIERIPPGRRLFSRGDCDGRSIFLLSGQLALVSADNRIRMLKAATAEAGQPVADHQPRETTALARTTITVLCVDTGVLRELLERGESASQQPAEPEPTQCSAPDLGPIFSSPLFARLPEPHLQVLKNRMSLIDVKAGDVVIEEGEDSAYYHIAASGRYRITSRLNHQQRVNSLGELGPLEGFGEAALIANESHDFSVTALEDGTLLRFSKGEFLTLIVRPYVKWIGCRDIEPIIRDGGILLDVRSQKSYAKHHLRNSINLPLRVLRNAASLLNRERRYIICCDNVRRSAAAAFLLAREGMEVLILNETVRGAPFAMRRRQSHHPSSDRAPG